MNPLTSEISTCSGELDLFGRYRAAETVARLSHPTDVDRLAAFAADRTLHIYTRREVAEAVARLGDSRGTAMLATMAADSALDAYARKWAAEALVRLANADVYLHHLDQDS